MKAKLFLVFLAVFLVTKVAARTYVFPEKIKFKLLSQNEGFLLINNKLYSTRDFGKTWNDISPVKGASVGDASFVDTKHIWAILIGRNKRGLLSFKLAKTLDGGLTWSIKPLQLFQTGEIDSIISDIFLNIKDEMTGYIVTRRATSINFSIGCLFKTSDGGDTWERLPIPIAEPVNFISEDVGWIVGGPGENLLYKTQNGGKTWEKIDIPLSKKIVNYKYKAVKFENTQLGIISVAVNYGDSAYLEFYKTNDGGKSWKFIRRISIESEFQPVSFYMFNSNKWVVIDTTKMTLFKFNGNFATYRKMESSFISEKVPSILHMEFVDENTGWAVFQKGPVSWLGATTDGGLSWQIIKKEKKIFETRQKENILSSISPLAANFQGQGFDTCQLPSPSVMQTWWNNSPYYFVNLYIGGVCRACSQPYLTKNNLLTLRNQGWKGFVPTWVGPQAPCSNFSYRISYDPITAYQQGRDEASNAIITAQNLGFSFGEPIYYDLEAYDTTNTTCRNAVKSFMQGWADELREDGYIPGVYGSSCASAMTDFTSIADVIWLAHWIYSYYNSSATVWDVACVSNSLWSNHQRIRQYTGGHNETYGGIVLNIDCDVADGKLATVKSSTAEQLTVYDFWRKDDPIYADPSSSCSNQNFDAQYKVRNDGSQSITIERLALAIHDSNNNHLWDLCIQNTCNPRYYDNVSLEPGETHWFERSFCYFQEGGNFKVVAKAKIDGVWYHLSSMDFEVKEQTLPDLIVENIWTDPAEFYPGDTVKLYARIKNIGDGDAVGTFRVQRYFDGDPISHYDKDGLAAGATITTYFTYTWPSDYNQHTIKVIVDLYDDITESNEDNNERSESFSASSPTLSSIDVTGPTSVNENSGAQYTCTAYWSDGSTSNVTSSATWSENSPYASIGSSGYLTTIEVSSDKSCRVTASYSGKTDYLDITIKNITYPLSYITISGPTEVNEDSGAQYTCTAHYTDGSSSDVTNSANWSEDSPYADISSTGYLTTSSVSSDQSCQITATYSGKSDNHNITIKNVNHPPELSSGDVSPDSGDTSTTFTYTVKYYDQDGDSPSAKYVYIDGSPHTMSRISGSASNGTYRYRTTLSAGSHNYYFYFTDGNGGSDRLPSSGTHSGPTVCPIPGTPANPNPSDGATNVSIDTDLDWSDCANTDSYDVYFGECPNPEYRDTVSGSSYNLPTLDYDTHYCWKIVAKNNCGNSTPGPVWDFTTGTCTYSIYPTSKHFGPSGGTGTINVTTQAGCAWTAVSHADWITITGGSPGTGSGIVYYSVSENSSKSSRTGTITIANETFTVTQSGTPTHKPMPWLHLLLEE